MLPASWKPEFDANGYAVTPRLLSCEELAPLRQTCERLLAETRSWALLGAAARHPVLLEFAKHAVFREICALTIGGDVDLYFDTIAFKPARSGKELRWHQDASYGRTDRPYIACWVPLVRTCSANGGLWVAPGSHKAGPVDHDRRPESEAAYAGPVATAVPTHSIALELDVGQVAVLHSDLLHRSGPNTSGAGRLAYLCGYANE